MERIKEEVIKLYIHIASMRDKYKISYSKELQEDLYEIADCLTRIEYEVWREDYDRK